MPKRQERAPSSWDVELRPVGDGEFVLLDSMTPDTNYAYYVEAQNATGRRQTSLGAGRKGFRLVDWSKQTVVHAFSGRPTPFTRVPVLPNQYPGKGSSSLVLDSNALRPYLPPPKDIFMPIRLVSVDPTRRGGVVVELRWHGATRT